jgi:hypothetical protein
MPKQDATYSGTSLLTHRNALMETIAANDIKSVLDIGCLGERNRKIAVTSDVFWYGHKTEKGDLSSLPYLIGTYDMVVACRWLSTFPVDKIPEAVDALYKIADKAIFIYEDESNSREVVPQRPLGWDRVDWSLALKGNRKKRVVFSMTAPSPSGKEQLCSYMTTDGKDGVWRVVKFGN